MSSWLRAVLAAFPDLLRYAGPTAVAAFGETIGQLGGIVNIGLEGCLLAGGFTAFVVDGSHGPYAALLAGGGVGLVVAFFIGLLVVNLKADAVVVGTAVNLLAVGMVQVLFKARVGDSGGLVSVPMLPRYGPFDAGIVLFVLLGIAMVWTLKTRGFGLLLRAAGEAPEAVEAAGFSASRIRRAGLAVSGMCGGLAGAYLVVGTTGSFSPTFTAGRGFVAIAMVTFGRWRPVWAVAGALGVGILETFQFAAQSAGLRATYQWWTALPYVAALAVLVLVGRGSRGPAKLGVPLETRR